MKKKTLKIGWIGTEIMGNPMAQCLIKRGYKIKVYNSPKTRVYDVVP